jgi:hypothetical protein
MADNNTATPSNPFQGVTFNTNAINALGTSTTCWAVRATTS